MRAYKRRVEELDRLLYLLIRNEVSGLPVMTECYEVKNYVTLQKGLSISQPTELKNNQRALFIVTVCLYQRNLSLKINYRGREVVC